MSAVLLCVFWVSAFLILYAYVLYPLAILGMAGKRVSSGEVDGPRRHGGIARSEARAVVIVAAFNEERHIGARVRNLIDQDYPADKLQIVVGSDGSSDRTVAKAREEGGTRVTVMDFPVNRGKASVLNDCIAAADADIVVLTDANTVFASDTVRQLVAAFEEGTGGICGELVIRNPGSGTNQDHSYWSFERRLKAAESAIGGLLGANGGVYAIRRECYRSLAPDTICDDFQIAMNIAVSGKALRYLPSAIAYEDSPSDVRAEFHRRIRIGIGNYQALFRHPEYLTRASWALRFTYLSHKVLRWLTPHLLLLVLLSSLLLSSRPLFAALAALQCIGYIMALMVYLSRDRIRWPGVIRGGMFFMLLNLAFLVGFQRFLAGNYRGSWRRTERQ